MKKQAFVLFLFLIAFVTCLVLVERTFSPVFQACIDSGGQNQEANADKKEDSAGQSVVLRYVQCTGAFLDNSEGTITAIATIIIAAFTGTLWFATSEQGRLTELTLIAGRRAFVFADGVMGLWEPNNVGGYNWRLTVMWKNTGETATRGLLLYSDAVLSNVRLPNAFDFNQIDRDAPPGTGMLGPKSVNSAGICPHYPRPALTAQDIADVQAGNKFLYLWGWCRYRDTFSHTPNYTSRFCWQVLVTGDPLTFDPNVDPHSIRFTNLYHSRGNCADDECTAQGLGQPLS